MLGLGVQAGHESCCLGQFCVTGQEVTKKTMAEANNKQQSCKKNTFVKQISCSHAHLLDIQPHGDGAGGCYGTERNPGSSKG